MNHIIKIPGHSGSKVSINFDSYCGMYVKKTSNDNRLVNQAYKQKLFFDKKIHDNITSPKIIKNCILNDDGLYEFHMKYITGFDIISFMSQSSVNEVSEFTEFLLRYFDKIIYNKTEEKVVNKVINKKINSVSESLMRNVHVRRNKNFKMLDSIIINLRKDVNNKVITLPVGVCHGDLTFSNMMYNIHTKKIVIFDFLDTYFESPVQDMIKLKQDLDFSWTFQKLHSQKQIDKKRYEIVTTYLNTKFEKYFKSFDFYNDNYKILQTLNLLRVIVYSRDCTTINYLIKCIERI
jgi:hypothetical protein